MKKLTIIFAISILTFYSCSNPNSTKQEEVKSEPCEKYIGHWESSEKDLEVTIKPNGSSFISSIKGFNATGDWSSKCENDELVIGGPLGNWTVGYETSSKSILLFGQKLQKTQE